VAIAQELKNLFQLLAVKSELQYSKHLLRQSTLIDFQAWTHHGPTVTGHESVGSDQDPVVSNQNTMASVYDFIDI